MEVRIRKWLVEHQRAVIAWLASLALLQISLFVDHFAARGALIGASFVAVIMMFVWGTE